MLRIFTVLLLCSAAYLLTAQYGALDPTFGYGGLVRTQYTQGYHGGYDLALQPDGKILVAGVATDSQSRLAVYRYLPSGDLDVMFGDSGIACLSSSYYSSSGYWLDLQPDGKIVVTGLITFEYLGREDLALTRFLPNGQPDASFGNGGLISLNIWGPREQPLEVAVQTDGNILVAGVAYDTLYFPHALLARFRPNGLLDASFGNDGLLFPTYIEGLGAGINVTLFQEGKILMGLSNLTGPHDYMLTRLNQDGTPDLAFGDNGLARFDFGNNERITSIVVQPDGKIVVAGDSEGNIPGVGIIRLFPDGSLDTKFGDSGQVLVNSDFAPCDPGSLALQPDGKTLMSIIVSVGASDDFGLVRLLQDGNFDPTFGAEGKVRTTFGNNSYDYAFSVAVQSDHKIIVSGYTNTGSDYAVALARYQSNFEPQPGDTSAVVVEKVKIYPNPTPGDATLEFTLGKEVIVSLDLYDTQGRLVQNMWLPETRAAGNYLQSLSLGDFVSAGVYFLAFNIGDQRRYLPVVKQ